MSRILQRTALLSRHFQPTSVSSAAASSLPASRAASPVRTAAATTARPSSLSSSSSTSRSISSTSPARMASHQLYGDDTPAEVRNAKGLHLVTMNTPNGKKVQIMLEELADLYGTQFSFSTVNISTNEQKKDWFLRLNPNGRIPVLLDNQQSPPFPVFETSAELLYLLKEHDKEDKLGFKDEFERSEALQWLFFWHGGGAPYQGQVHHFTKAAPEKLPYAINRFRNEVLRVFGVLEIRLSGKYTGEPRDYLAGKGKGKYSVADIGTWPWVNGWKFSGFTDEEMAPFPHLLKWIDRIAARPAVQRGSGDKYALK